MANGFASTNSSFNMTSGVLPKPQIVSAKRVPGTNGTGLGDAGTAALNIGLGLLRGDNAEDIAFNAGAAIGDAFVPGLGSSIRFGQQLANGADGREAVAGALNAGVTGVATFFGGPVAGAAASRYFQPAIQDTVSLGKSSEATKNAIASRLSNYLSGGLDDVADFLGIKEIGELGVLKMLGLDEEAIGSALGKTGLFGKQNKGSLAREGLAKEINKQLEKAGSELRLNDFYKQFTPGGEIDKKLEELGERDPEALADAQKLGQVLGLVTGLDDAGTINVGNMVAASFDGDPTKAKQMFEELGASPEVLLGKTIEAFNQGKYSVVQTVEAARAIDRAFGTGLAGSPEIKEIASLVEEGGSDRLADGSVFDISQGEARGLGQGEDRLEVVDPLEQTRPATIDTQESSASIDIGRSNLVDSFSRVQSGNSLTPDKPVDDIRFSMQILRERLESEGKDPNSDETIQAAQRLIAQLQGEFI